MINQNSGILAAILISCGLLSACDSRKPAPAPSPATAPTPAAAKVDWSTVKADSLEKTMESFTHLSRYADAWGKGASETVRISFLAPSSVTDGAGHTAALTPEGWKGSVEAVRDAVQKHGSSGIQAVPTAKNNYHDGLGKVPRFAYTVTMDGDTMVFKKFKAKGDESNG